MSRLQFLIEALKNFRQVGTVTRSGRFVRRKMASFINANDRFILELGAGDGALTRGLLETLHPEGKLLSFEINENLHQTLLTIDDPRLIAINDTAENMEVYMREHNIEEFDAVVSAIPYIVLPEDLAFRILKLCRKNLKPKKPYLQLHYAKNKTALYRRIFGHLESHRIWMNIPPAYIFECKNEK